MRAADDVLIIDNSSLDSLRDEESRGLFRGSCRAAGWTPYPSALNLMEAYKATGSRHGWLVDTLNWLREDRGLLPLPHEILRATGRAIAESRSLTKVNWSGWEAGLAPEDLEDGMREALTGESIRVLEEQERTFRMAHETAAQRMPPLRRRLSNTERNLPLHRFLDEIFLVPETLEDYVSSLWLSLELPGDPPVERLIHSEAWRLYLEAVGTEAYRQAYLANKLPRVGWVDWMQVVYLSGSVRGLLVVTESALRDGATHLLRGRYPGRSVCPPESLLAR